MLARRSKASASFDHRPVPARRILTGQRYELAVVAPSRAAPGLRVEHECEQAQRLRFLGQQLRQQPGQEHGFFGQITAGDIGPAGVGPTFPERSVDRIQHGGEPIGQLCALRDAERNSGLPDLVCGKCGGKLKIVAYLHDQVAIKQVLAHLGLSPPEEPKPPPAVHEVVRVPVDEEGREMEAP